MNATGDGIGAAEAQRDEPLKDASVCGLSEAALEQGLLAPLQLEAIRPDLEASLPWLKSSRQLLVAIPASFEEHPRVVDLVRDDATLGRLRRLHQAFGQALRDEKIVRELDALGA